MNIFKKMTYREIEIFLMCGIVLLLTCSFLLMLWAVGAFKKEEKPEIYSSIKFTHSVKESSNNQ